MPASSIWCGVSPGRKCAGASLKRTSFPSGPSAPEWQGTCFVPVGSVSSCLVFSPPFDAAGGRSLGSAACLRLREEDMVRAHTKGKENSSSQGGGARNVVVEKLLNCLDFELWFWNDL